MAFDLEPSVSRPWLVRLRWLFFAGQIAVLTISRVTGADPGHHRGVLIAAVAAYGLSNLALFRFWGSRAQPARLMGAVLLLDGVLLTIMLAASGGSSNPFSVLYLVHITLAALVLGARWTFAVSALCILEYSLLFLMPQAHHHHGSAGFDQHLYGMFAAFVLAAALIAFFVGKIARAIAAQREQIAALREDAARNARLASITTLAAGAAHELGSPLATIAVAAHEASLRLNAAAAVASSPAPSAAAVAPIASDLRLILLEVDRCQDILSQLAARSAQADDPRPISLDKLAEELRQLSRELHGEAAASRLDIHAGDATPALRVPVEQLAQSLAALVKNALDASAVDEQVRVTLQRQPRGVRIAVADRGAGIEPERLPHVGEPFFTTKEPGRGLGLGVFLARAFFESQGGTLRIESTLGRGTTVVGELPLSAGELPERAA